MSRLLVTQYQAEVEKIIRYGGSKKETQIGWDKTVLLPLLPIDRLSIPKPLMAFVNVSIASLIMFILSIPNRM